MKAYVIELTYSSNNIHDYVCIAGLMQAAYGSYFFVLE